MVLDTQFDIIGLNNKEYNLDRDGLAAKLGFKRSDIDMLINIFKKNANVSLEEMNRMIKQNNIQGIADAAHAIKGSAGNLKMDKIFELSKNIEIMAKTMKNEEYKVHYIQLKNMIAELD